MVEQLLQSFVDNGVIDSFRATNSKILIKSGKDTYMVAKNSQGFFVHSSKDPKSGFECYTSTPDVVLSRYLANEFLGLTDAKFNGREYNGVNIYPKRVLSSAVEFSTAKGKTFLVSTSNTRVTLGLYDILYSIGGEDSVMMMPKLDPDETVEILSSYGTSIRSEYLNQLCATSIGNHTALPVEYKTRILQNNFLFGKSSVRPSFNAMQILGQSSRFRMKSTNSGYKVEAQAKVDGVTYDFSGKMVLPTEVVSSAVSKTGEQMHNLIDGVDLGKDWISPVVSSCQKFESDMEITSGAKFKESRYVDDKASKLASSWLGVDNMIRSVRTVCLDL